jgi:hypothetical protein
LWVERERPAEEVDPAEEPGEGEEEGYCHCGQRCCYINGCVKKVERSGESSNALGYLARVLNTGHAMARGLWR